MLQHSVSPRADYRFDSSATVQWQNGSIVIKNALGGCQYEVVLATEDPHSLRHH